MTDETNNSTEYNLTDATVETYVPYKVENSETKKREFRESKPITLFSLNGICDNVPPYRLETETLPDGKQSAEIVYQDKRLQFVQEALTRRVKGTAAARWRSGEDADETLDSILSRSRGGSTYLSELAACKAAIASYMVKKGLPANSVAQLVKKLVPAALASADEKLQNTVANILNKWQEEEPEEASKHSDIIQRFADAMASDDSFLDDLTI